MRYRVFFLWASLLVNSQAEAGATSELEGRIQSAFRCFVKSSIFASDAEFNVRLSELKKNGEFSGDVMADYSAGRRESYKIYGSMKMVGDEMRIEEIVMKTPADQKYDKKLPPACVR